jgi:glycosyltransferase involved in cell wall biosynthesis
MGWIAQDKVEQYFRLADVIYYGLYDSSGNSRFSSPNALFHAMQFGKPVITTDIGEIADIVRKENCGLVIEQPTAPLIAQAMNELYDQKLRQKLGSNGRRAAETKYNWAVSEKSLLSVYKNLEFTSL